MDRQISHLVRLVDDLLDISRISRGKIDLRKERLNLAEIVEAALQMSDIGLSPSGRQLTVSVPAEPLAVQSDRVRLVQVIANSAPSCQRKSADCDQIRLNVRR